MSIINSSLEVVYCSILASNYDLIRFIIFVSRFTGKLCNAFFISSRFNSPCRCWNFFFGILNFATKQELGWSTQYSADSISDWPPTSSHGPQSRNPSCRCGSIFCCPSAARIGCPINGQRYFQFRLLASNLILSNSEARTSDVFKSNQKLKQAAILINKSKSEQAVEDSVCAYLAR